MQNAFLIKQGSGRIQLSREKGNLLNKNTFRCSGLANSKAVHIGTPTGLATPFAVKTGNKFFNSTLKSKVGVIFLRQICWYALFLLLCFCGGCI